MKNDTALLGSRIAGGNTAFSRNKYDAYQTPPDVTKALLDFLRLPKTTRFWECACGDGTLNLELYTRLANSEAPDMPMIIEHLTTDEAYVVSVQYVKDRLSNQ